MTNNIFNHLLRKYDVPVPRYTSYPTVPLWDTEKFTTGQWAQAVERSFNESNEEKGISLYVHLPFCESLCTYCACNTRITKDHRVEEKYMDALLREWSLYLKLFGRPPIIRELHLGGGTPTFFSAGNLSTLILAILKGAVVHDHHEFSFEGHPNNTTLEHLQILHGLGFKRVSYGVQDIDPKVQQAIHRIQPYSNVEAVTAWSRAAGYGSVNFDLIYGLPYQTVDTMRNTIEKLIQLRPDRVSFYSYAHVPWMRPGQRGYEDADLPHDVVKRSLYETGRRLFIEAGYEDVGMDHFALPDDSLFQAQRNETLHRNFMGYTTTRTDLLIGLGVSAIGDAKYAYGQNLKKVEDYYEEVMRGEWPVFKGHIQTTQDQFIRKCIISIACQGKLPNDILYQVMTHQMFNELVRMEQEGIVELNSECLRVTAMGKAFIRNVCSLFDQRMQTQKASFNTSLFSKSI